MHNKISVIICTYNRYESLKDTLSGLLHQNNNTVYDYEIIVVDNNSDDGTKRVVEDYYLKFDGKLKYLFEPKQGKTYALNKGIKEARGDIVALTDDDVMLDNGWLESIYNTFVNTNCDAMGGKILPNWAKMPPRWLTERFYPYLALLDYGDKAFQIKSAQFELWGANFCIRKNIFEELGYFNTMLGHKGNKIFGGEEVDLFRRLLLANKKIFYQPKAVVYHKIGKYKLTKNYFRKWHFDKGQLRFELNQCLYKKPEKAYPLSGIPYWLYKKLFRMILSYLNQVLKGGQTVDELFEKELDLFYHMGIMVGAHNSRIGR